MTSPPALLYDTCYHIFSRGVNRENVFIEERNYEYFIRLYGIYVQPVAETLAYCLMRNHFHLLVRIKLEEELSSLRVSKTCRDLRKQISTPSQQFSNLLNAYAKAINKAHGRTGSLFQHPFGRVRVITHSHLLRAVKYIHHNPQKHGFVKDFRDWPYSSFHALTGSGITWVQRASVLDWFSGETGLLCAHDMHVDEKFARKFAPDDD